MDLVDADDCRRVPVPRYVEWRSWKINMLNTEENAKYALKKLFRCKKICVGSDIGDCSTHRQSRVMVRIKGKTST